MNIQQGKTEPVAAHQNEGHKPDRHAQPVAGAIPAGSTIFTDDPKDPHMRGRCRTCGGIGMRVRDLIDLNFKVTDSGRLAIGLLSTCRSCGEEWIEVYVLDHVEDL